MRISDMALAMRYMSDSSLNETINKKVGQVVESIDVNKLIADPNFQKMLAMSLASRATGGGDGLV